MEQENIAKLFSFLERGRERPALLTGKAYQPKRVNIYLLGLSDGLKLAGFDFWSLYYLQVIEKKGWVSKPEGIIPQMKRAGLSKKEIVEELIDIHTEIYRLGFQQSDK